jgi:hypothetical protein
MQANYGAQSRLIEGVKGIIVRRAVSDHFWSFLIGLLVGTSTGVLSGVALVAVLGGGP